MATDMVLVAPVKRITEELNSLIAVIQEIIAPLITPGNIITAVTLKKVLRGEAPKLMDASSRLGLS
jgi:hypothetical protein